MKAGAMQSKPKALRLTHPISATAMPNPNFPSSNHRAQFIPARDSRNRRIPVSTFAVAAITRSFGLIWVTGKKPRADFRFGTATINPCALYQPRAKHSRSKRHERRENHASHPRTQTSLLQIIARPILRKQKCNASGLARWKMNARQSSAGAIISATCESIRSLRPPLPPTSTSG